MFHSFGTVQSNTVVPVGTSSVSEIDLLGDQSQRLPQPVAGNAPADGVEPADARVRLGADGVPVRGLEGSEIRVLRAHVSEDPCRIGVLVRIRNPGSGRRSSDP